jgi:iron complex outermembrane receptor protein
LDAYLYNYKNYQVDELEWFIGQFGTQVFGDFISNAASARHKGFELETQALITPHDQVSLNVSYLSAVFQRFNFPNPTNPGFPSPVTYSDLSGYTEYYAPRWSGSLSYQHAWPLRDDSELSFYAQSHFESYSWGSPDHQPDSRQPGYTHSRLALQFRSSGSKYNVQAYVHNLENRVIRNFYTFQGPPSSASLGPLYLPPPAGGATPPQRNFISIDPPRTFGVTLQVKF